MFESNLAQEVIDSQSLQEQLAEFRAIASEIRKNPERAISFGHGTYALPQERILAFPRKTGESRYPYGENGFNFWASASGYMYSNDGLFSLFPVRSEGQDPTIAFFASLESEEGWAPLSLLGVPFLNDERNLQPERFTVFTRSCVYYITETEDFSFCVRVFSESSKRLCITVHVENKTGREKKVLLSSFFNPMLRHQLYDTNEDRWFRGVQSRPDNANHCGRFEFHVNEDKDRFTSISNNAVLSRFIEESEVCKIFNNESTTSLPLYKGNQHASLSHVPALRTGTFENSQDVTAFTDTSIAADLIELELQPTSSVRMDYVFDLFEGEQDITGSNIIFSQSDCDDLIISKEIAQSETSSLTMKVEESKNPELEPEVFNAFFEHLKKQVEFCSLLKGYIQLSENSLIGIRDVFQALEALLYWRPDAVREKMLEALNFTLTDGRCLRQYSLPNKSGVTGRMDLRPFIDQGCWVISTVTSYLRYTGDTQFLDQQCGYHEFSDSRVVPSTKQDTVLQHLSLIMDFLISNLDSDTGCIRALYGDWNDALDGLGVMPGNSNGYGNGVSVMASLQVFQNLNEMNEIFALHGSPQNVEYSKIADSLSKSLIENAIQTNAEGEKRILHGWGHNREYFAGSFNDPDGQSRDSLTSNSFWVLSGMLKKAPELKAVILSAFDRLEGKYGLKTFHPHFPPDSPEMGRIGKMPAGTGENGGTYVHATAFAIMALFEMDETRRAWDELTKILPFTSLHKNLSHSPFVMPNSYGHNPTLHIDGQNMNDWQTGSSNVVFKIFIRNVIGLRIKQNEISINPAKECPFKNWQASLSFRGVNLNISFKNLGNHERKNFLNSKLIDGPFHFNISQLLKEFKELNVLIED